MEKARKKYLRKLKNNFENLPKEFWVILQEDCFPKKQLISFVNLDYAICMSNLKNSITDV